VFGGGAYDAFASALSVRGLLFTDIEGSTALVRRLGDRFGNCLADITRSSGPL
jgi:hypothetical protein